ncbi:hypothetical protein [Clostridium fessum]|uniref:hypothetical protein n=1 Tax=Clostridium fessum TaxID=2126740 RepID=UPI003999BF69
MRILASQKIRRCGESGYRLLGECEMTEPAVLVTVESVLSWDTVHRSAMRCAQLIGMKRCWMK